MSADDTTIGSLRLAKMALEDELNSLISEKVAGFVDITGVQVKGINIEFASRLVVGQRDDSYDVQEVKVRLHLPM